jgi:hypothetical protein
MHPSIAPEPLQSVEKIALKAFQILQYQNGIFLEVISSKMTQPKESFFVCAFFKISKVTI